MNALPQPDFAAWSIGPDEVLSKLGVDGGAGLDDDEALRRALRWGRNELRESRPRSLVSILAAQFRSVVVLLLVGAGMLSVFFADLPEAVAIFAVILINGAIGFFTEWRATRSMEALRRYARVDCTVLRSGSARRILAEDLVPGDIVILEAGDLVPADLRIIAAAKLAADESTLTGESLPVEKHSQTLPADTSMLDRENMAYKGTVMTRGAGRGVVVTTGMHTEFGKIFEQVSEAEAQQTPLERRIDALGERLVWGVLVVAAVIAVAGVVAGRGTFLAIEVAIALAVAAIPEGLPIVATIALARGMWRMARRNALITKLSAVETLGATSVILTDKTGTLTENRMAVTRVLLADRDVNGQDTQLIGEGRFRSVGAGQEAAAAALLDEVLTIAALCNNAALQEEGSEPGEGVGDPTELALLTAASGRGLWRDTLIRQYPEIREEPFDPASKRMATVHESDAGYLVAVKGAPESLLGLCTAELTIDGVPELTDERRRSWLRRVEQLGANGLRTLAIASRRSSARVDDPFTGLTLLGVVGLEDPPREGVDTALKACRDAGISVVMVTGDHASTARNIAEELGIVAVDAGDSAFVDGREFDRLQSEKRDRELLDAKIFSRVTPEQKLELIDLYQQQGHVVAMTGDGVNDAPALKKADIGVAMGVRGTAVAKEAAEMILQDDEFGTIVAAVEHGRVIFENIRKFVIYLLSCNISEVLVVVLATVAGAPLPLLPLQILFLNLVTDVFPALALGVGGGSATIMQSKPRSSGESILLRRHWTQICIYGAVMAITVLLTMTVAFQYLEFERSRAVTVAFCTLALAQMWHVFNMRAQVRCLLSNEITRNVWIWLALLICLMLILAAVYLPMLRDVLRLVEPGPDGWLLIGIGSVMPLLFAPVVRSSAAALAKRWPVVVR